MKSSETASAPRKGYAIFIDTVCDGSTPVVLGGEGQMVIFESEIEAQREVADHQMTRLQEFLDGEREFDDAMSVDEYVVPVMVRPGGVLVDGEKTEAWGWWMFEGSGCLEQP